MACAVVTCCLNYVIVFATPRVSFGRYGDAGPSSLSPVSQRYAQSEREDVEDHRREPLINVTFDLRLLGSRDLARNHGPHVRLPNVRLEVSEPGHLTPVGSRPEENEQLGVLGLDHTETLGRSSLRQPA